jgi:hypothetical protein
MKKLLGIIILGLFLITPSQADDIRDFQTAGMSIGDSLLDYATKEEHEQRSKTDYPASKKFSRYTLRSINFKIYDDVQFHFKTDDSKYIISSISGGIYYKKNIKNCFKKKDEVVEEISNLFEDAKMKDKGTSPWLSADKSGNTKTTNVYFYLKSGAYIEIACYDWSKEITEKKNWTDHLKIAVYTKEIRDWLNNEAF